MTFSIPTYSGLQKKQNYLKNKRKYRLKIRILKVNVKLKTPIPPTKLRNTSPQHQGETKITNNCRGN